jgi:hypothetical protein
MFLQVAVLHLLMELKKKFVACNEATNHWQNFTDFVEITLKSFAFILDFPTMFIMCLTLIIPTSLLQSLRAVYKYLTVAQTSMKMCIFGCHKLIWDCQIFNDASGGIAFKILKF